MITVVIAVGDSSRGQHYRRLLAQTGFEGHFAADLGILARIVKSRPVDVVIYDISSQFIPPTDWLDMIAKDSDLGLTPVLWIGSGIVPSLARRLDAHRPGVRLAKLTDAPTLVEVVDSLVGRPRGATSHSAGGSPPDGMPENWVPPDDTIDDALSIFSESSSIPVHEETASKPAATKQAAVPSSGASACPPTASPMRESTSTNLRARTSPPPESGDDEKLQVDIIRTTGTHVARLAASGPQKPLMAGDTSGAGPDSGPVIAQLDPIEDIVTEVAKRMVAHIVLNLDRDLIRREVERVLEQRKSPANS